MNLKLEDFCQRNKFAVVINLLSSYLEGNEPIPDHWEEDKRQDYYQDVQKMLTRESKRMIARLAVLE